MNIGEILKSNDIYTYNQLQKMKQEQKKNEDKVKLGDSIENLMKAHSYKRVGRRIKQIR